MPTLEMTKQEAFEARQSFIAERIAIMIHDGGMVEDDAAIEAGKCWVKYFRRINAGQQATLKI